MRQKTIDLERYIGNKDTALVGRNSGENLMNKLKQKSIILEEIESKFDSIKIVIPERIITMNKSFFLGAFETRVQKLGKDEFCKKYDFEASDYIKNKIPKHVDSALLKASMEDILGG